MILVYVVVGLVGGWVGRFVYRCVERLPYEQSVLWPGTRCGHCAQPVPALAHLPIVGYWLAGRRCECKTPLPLLGWLTEVLTAACFVAVLYLDLDRNILRIDYLADLPKPLSFATIPAAAWGVVVWHALLVTLLLTASLCDLRHMEIPLALTMTGTFVGIAGSVFVAWPFPGTEGIAPAHFLNPLPKIPLGAVPWPVWHDLPPSMPLGSWQVGLATSIVGAATGMLILRGVRFLFGLGRGMEGLGVGDADLMMMAGAFVGWQVVLIGFFVSVFPALVFALSLLVLRGEQYLPFGPSLAAGVLITLFGWSWIGPQFRPILGSGEFLAILAVLGGVLLLGLAFFLRLLRGAPEDD